jgi:hypothetical protein
MISVAAWQVLQCLADDQRRGPVSGNADNIAVSEFRREAAFHDRLSRIETGTGRPGLTLWSRPFIDRAGTLLADHPGKAGPRVPGNAGRESAAVPGNSGGRCGVPGTTA